MSNSRRDTAYPDPSCTAGLQGVDPTMIAITNRWGDIVAWTAPALAQYVADAITNEWRKER